MPAKQKQSTLMPPLVRKPNVLLGSRWGRRNTAGVVIASSIRFENVSHQYGERETLKNVDLCVNPGEVMCLLGPSGSGKTTLLRLAAGLSKPNSGNIYIDNQVVSSPDHLVPPEKRGVGLVFQEFALFPHLTIMGNVQFGLSELAKHERKEYAQLILERVGLADSADLYPNNLSGGEQQRVALARALAPRPGILLMDEPFSGLDARLRENIRDETLELLRDTRSTVLIVTHDPEEALKISDRIALLKDGKIIQTGSGEELFKHPNSLFSARFFSYLNIIPAQITGGSNNKKISTPLGDFNLSDLSQDIHVDAKDIKFCIRPSDFTIKEKISLKTRGDTSSAKKAKTGRRKDDEDANMKEAYIRSRRFEGEFEMLEVLVPGYEEPIYIRLRQGELAQSVGEIWVEVKPEKTLVFEN